jgi:hypothetical protein
VANKRKNNDPGGTQSAPASLEVMNPNGRAVIITHHCLQIDLIGLLFPQHHKPHKNHKKLRRHKKIHLQVDKAILPKLK